MLLFDERQRRRVDTHSMNANSRLRAQKLENFGAAFTEFTDDLIAKDSERFGRADKTALSDLASLHPHGKPGSRS
jgi:hypothetical protein